ncbi:MAG: hypothetical protein RDV41_06650 [Planctomycetota bacterium]|nr:hypothetical protein [Planctomycetota bacterium]
MTEAIERISELIRENARLKQRVMELEMETGNLKSSLEAPKTVQQSSKVLELLKQKDATLERNATELEEKNVKLEAMVAELKGKNEELQNWLAAQRLFRAIFDSEPSAMIGLDKDARILQVNTSAIRRFGEGLRFLMFEPVESLPTTAVGRIPVGQMVREVLADGKQREAEFEKSPGRKEKVVVYGLASGPDVRGVIVRI